MPRRAESQSHTNRTDAGSRLWFKLQKAGSRPPVAWGLGPGARGPVGAPVQELRHLPVRPEAAAPAQPGPLLSSPPSPPLPAALTSVCVPLPAQEPLNSELSRSCWPSMPLRGKVRFYLENSFPSGLLSHSWVSTPFEAEDGLSPRQQRAGAAGEQRGAGGTALRPLVTPRKPAQAARRAPGRCREQGPAAGPRGGVHSLFTPSTALSFLSGGRSAASGTR